MISLWPEGVTRDAGGCELDGITMTLISAGRFRMGSDDARANEAPAHWVFMPSFLIDRGPVTRGNYARFMDATGHRAPPGWRSGRLDPRLTEHPVVNVTWDDALAFATWSGRRLPTEAEWEKAASWDPQDERQRRWPWGDQWRTVGGRVSSGIIGILLRKGTTEVGRHSPQGDSPYGVADMAGNVWEWCSSLYLPYPYVAADGREDRYAHGSRVLRGGPWANSPDDARTTKRLALLPRRVLDGVCGFRCALDA